MKKIVLLAALFSVACGVYAEEEANCVSVWQRSDSSADKKQYDASYVSNSFSFFYEGSSYEEDARWKSKDLVISADVMAADNVSSTVVATGNVCGTSAPLRLWSQAAEKRGDHFSFAPDTKFTTCTNENCSLHWHGTGEAEYCGTEGARYAVVRNVTLRLFDVPVFWLPYWYYPMDTDYGWRVMPGYTSKWGAYLLMKYVYHIAGDFAPGSFGLSGNTRFDLRTKNGIALGQELTWQLGSFGHGKIKGYYAWDRDADRYRDRWDSPEYRYNNWGSEVPDERYALQLEHFWEPTERDRVYIRAAYFSDMNFRSDFLRDTLFGNSNRYMDYDGNELAWEHIESRLAFGLTASGPLNDFYSGVARLPEFYFDVLPQPIFSTPLNYESSTRVGFLNRNYAKIGDKNTSRAYRYMPGEWADYQTFRLDTYHRITLPFKIADVLSVVPRVGFRGTLWGDSGYENLTGVGRAGRIDDNVFRSIFESGVTFAARGVAQFDNGWNHLFEPYIDVLAQEANYSGLNKNARPYIFDSIDASSDWLDQFAGRSRNLPYSWYGVTPGIRNALRKVEENGSLRTVLDFDLYAAFQVNDTTWTSGNKLHRLTRNVEDPNYGENGIITPGFRLRWMPAKNTMLASRVEFDCESTNLAYADVAWQHRVAKGLQYKITFSHRDQRIWDFSSAVFDPAVMTHDEFNQAKYSYLDFEVEHDICDSLAWGPFVRWDCSKDSLDEIGTWIDFRTDCLGFRFSISYEKDYTRIDGSEKHDDWRFGFFIYLRAFGASSGSPF